MLKLVTIAVAGLMSVGCATNKETYYWGSYEQGLYEMYSSSEGSDVETQISKLTQDISEAEAKGKRVPPGVHAHLGYMYTLSGNVSEAISAFAVEKESFPESETLIDGMMNRLKEQN